MASSREDNFCCIIIFFVDIMANVLRRYFVFKMGKEDPTNTLDKFLFAKQNTILQLKNKKVLSESQFNLICPPYYGNVQQADISKWDITLLVCLIRNLLPVSNSEKVRLDVIKDLRNRVYAHAHETALDETTFEDVWKKLENCSKLFLNEIGDFFFTERIKNEIKVLKVKSFAESIAMVQTMSTFFTWDDRTYNAVLGVKRSMEDVTMETAATKTKRIATVSPTTKNLKDRFKTALESKRRKYFESEIFEDMHDTLLKKGSVLLYGTEFEETFTTGLVLANATFESSVVLLDSPNEWNQIDIDDSKCILINMQRSKCVDSNVWLDVIKSINDSKIPLVVTTDLKNILEVDTYLREKENFITGKFKVARTTSATTPIEIKDEIAVCSGVSRDPVLDNLIRQSTMFFEDLKMRYKVEGLHNECFLTAKRLLENKHTVCLGFNSEHNEERLYAFAAALITDCGFQPDTVVVLRSPKHWDHVNTDIVKLVCIKEPEYMKNEEGTERLSDKWNNVCSFIAPAVKVGRLSVIFMPRQYLSLSSPEMSESEKYQWRNYIRVDALHCPSTRIAKQEQDYRRQNDPFSNRHNSAMSGIMNLMQFRHNKYRPNLPFNVASRYT